MSDEAPTILQMKTHRRRNLIQMAVEGEVDVLVHGCNCFCTMDAGFAKALVKVFPEALAVDMQTMVGDRSKLGQASVAQLEMQHTDSADDKTLFIVNGYTQYSYGKKGRYVDYAAVRSVFRGVKENFSGKRIGFPKIGSGNGGGNWDIIANIIQQELEGEEFFLVTLD